MIPFVIFFFIFGLIIGSFLNVVIYRINTKKTLGGRSACMSCQSKLRWYELIPVASFFSLKGRCRTCKTKISIQYPMVELVTGVIYAFLFLKLREVFFTNTIDFVVVFTYYALMFSILVVIAVYDIKHKIIPDALALLFGILAFVGMFLFTRESLLVFSPHMISALEILSGLLVASPFAFFWLVSGGRWMGLGDAKLAIGIGWLLGLSYALSALVVSFWSGAIVGIFLVILSKRHKIGPMGMKSEVPFAPFLVLGTLLVFLFGWNFFNFSF